MSSPSRRVSAAVLALALVGLSARGLSAQAARGTITGDVTESGTGRPLAGAQVFVPNTGLGTLTNDQGKYVLANVPAGAVALRVQMLGYVTGSKDVTLAGGQTLTENFALAQSAIALDQVVVTGTGAPTSAKKLGNTVATVNAAEIVRQGAVSSVSEVLQGREPSLAALPTGGLAGEGARIRIRGTSSLTQSLQPVVYVDGIRVDNTGGFGPGVAGNAGQPSRLDDIDPASIERIEVLKGAAAATLYGTEASKGVIQIFTKKGTNSAPRWTLSLEEAVERYPERYAPLAGFAMADTATTAAPHKDSGATFLSKFYGQTIRPFQPFEYDSFGRLYETGHARMYGLEVTGGGSTVTYYVSGRYQNENGPFGGRDMGPAEDVDGHKQGTINLAIVPRDNLKLSISSLYNQSNHQTPENANNIYGVLSSVINSKPELASCVGGASAVASVGHCEAAGNEIGATSFATTRETMQRILETDAQHFAGSLNANYQPLQGMALATTFGIDMVSQQAVSDYPFHWNVDNFTQSNVLGFRRVANRNNLNLTFDAHGSWERNLTPAVSSQFVTGLQVYSSTTKRNYGTGTNFPGPGIDVAGAGELQTVNESFLATRQMGVFGQEQLGFKEYLFATVGGRYDKHSAFGENAGGAFYPKVSLSFVPSDVPGWRGFGPVSSLRLRSALGRSGLQPGAFDKFTTFTPLASSSGPGLAPSNLGNPDLKPEVSTELEAGSEIGFWSDRAGIDFTYWHRTVDNVLIARQFEMSGGFRNPQLDNIGQMKAWGLELNGKALVINRPNLQLNLNANAAFLRERITDMGGAPPIKVDYVRYRIYLGEGYAPGSFFGPKVPGACSARPAGKTYTCLNEGEAPLDTNGDGKPDTKDQLLAYLAKPRSGDDVGRGVLAAMDDQADNIPGFYLGKNTPDWSGSFGGDLRVHKRWAINALFTYKFGNYYVHNLTYGFRRSSWRNIAESVRNEAVLLNPASTPEQRYDAAVEFATKLKALSPLDGLNEIEKADYLRFQELGLSYDVPASFLGRFGARSMTLSVKGRNLALFTGYSGVDPEANVVGLTEATTTTNQVSNNFLSGIDGWTLPLPRRVSFSARIGF